MDPTTMWQAAMDTLPLLVLRGVAVVILALGIFMATCVIGAVACHRSEPRQS